MRNAGIGTFLVEDRETEVSDFERGFLSPVSHEEVFGLQVSVDDVVTVAVLHHRDDGVHQGGRCALAVVSASSDPVEQLSSGAKLHHQMHVVLVFERSLKHHYIGMPSQVMHDGDLPPAKHEQEDSFAQVHKKTRIFVMK